MTTKSKTSLIDLALLWIVVSLFSRVMPHPFDASATISLSLWAPIFFRH
jgi:hypothetical protein